MSLKLMYITNNPDVAKIAEKYGVDRIWIDLETLGKEERQKNRDTVKSHHTLQDISVISRVLTKSELLVRINPWNPNSYDEIEQVILAGAERIMLPMWRSAKEAAAFLRAVNARAHTTLLLETKEAVECLDEIFELPFLDEIHIGLNDLHLSYGMTFMFEPLSAGIVESLCQRIRAKGIECGFGGIARLGEGLIPAEQIVMEHYRLGSTCAILSRSFCNTDEITDLQQIDDIFSKNLKALRQFEASLCEIGPSVFEDNKRNMDCQIEKIVRRMKEKA